MTAVFPSKAIGVGEWQFLDKVPFSDAQDGHDPSPPQTLPPAKMSPSLSSEGRLLTLEELR